MPSKGKNSRRSKKKEDDYQDIFEGELKKRKFGIRIDDNVEITVIAGNELLVIRGRLLSMKDDLELVDEDGNYVKIIMDWVVTIRVLEHNRPRPDVDSELIKKSIKTKPKKANVDHAYN